MILLLAFQLVPAYAQKPNERGNVKTAGEKVRE